MLIKYLPYIRNTQSLCSDFSAGCLYMWNKYLNIQFCLWNDTLLIREIIGGQVAFSYPIGANPEGMIDELKAYVYQNRLPLRFFAVDGKTLESIQEDKRLKHAMWAYDRRWSDYVYRVEDALMFKGKRFSGQRNHINRFKKLYGEPHIRFLTEDDSRSVAEFLETYAKEHRGWLELEKREFEQTKNLFDACRMLGLYSAGLFVDEKLAAFSIGEISGDMLLIHTEKALRKYEGVYPTMYSGFIRLLSEAVNQMPKFINREDDSGDAGLRTSKMQYHPTALIHKYLVHVGTPAAKAVRGTVLAEKDIVLTEIRESDRQAYLALNTDEDNNRLWGYDYRKDPGITGALTEDTFYDSVLFDMQAGDSVNFAVRQSEDGPMIGETILWNFTSDGFAEVGCRLFPAYHGKGYGRRAFGLTADYAECSLNTRVTARCFHENIPSHRMITANGFVHVRRDDTYEYFERRAATDR
ncbi:MAG: GNAT family N-acetyltransferase [Clostridiales bacterium]|nr:GNAT family N-acetyltransferase [Clostridiales bacterium]